MLAWVALQLPHTMVPLVRVPAAAICTVCLLSACLAVVPTAYQPDGVLSTVSADRLDRPTPEHPADALGPEGPVHHHARRAADDVDPLGPPSPAVAGLGDHVPLEDEHAALAADLDRGARRQVLAAVLVARLDMPVVRVGQARVAGPAARHGHGSRPGW